MKKIIISSYRDKNLLVQNGKVSKYLSNNNEVLSGETLALHCHDTSISAISWLWKVWYDTGGEVYALKDESTDQNPSFYDFSLDVLYYITLSINGGTSEIQSTPFLITEYGLLSWWKGASNLNDSIGGHTMACANPKYLVGNGFEIFGGDDYPGGPASKSYKVPYTAALSFGPTDNFTIEGNFIGQPGSSLCCGRQNTDFSTPDYALLVSLNTITIQVAGVGVITYTTVMTPYTSHFDGALNRWVLDTSTFYAIKVGYANGTWSVTIGGVVLVPNGGTGEYFPIPANTNSYGYIFGNPGCINRFTALKIYNI
jgi:hypothetical protein